MKILKVKTEDRFLLLYMQEWGGHGPACGAADTVLVYQEPTRADASCKPVSKGRFMWPSRGAREESLSDPFGIAGMVIGNRYGKPVYAEFSEEAEATKYKERLWTYADWSFPHDDISIKTECGESLPSPGSLQDFPDRIVAYGESCGDGDIPPDQVTFQANRHLCICSRCGEKFHASSLEETAECPKCGLESYPLVENRYLKYLKNAYPLYDRSKPASKASDSYMLARAFSDGAGIARITMECSVKDGVVTKSVKETALLSNRTKKGFGCVKHSVRGDTKTDAFQILGMKGKDMKEGCHILYDECRDFQEFAYKNQEALRAIGYMECLKTVSEPGNPEKTGMVFLENLFLFYMGIINKYPAAEQLVKAGHAGLVSQLYERAHAAPSAEKIASIAQSLGGIIHPEATRGKDVLRFPPYIGDYLLKKGAGVDEYVAWCNLYELKQFSREQFEKFTGSFEYAWMNANIFMPYLYDILKYGYNLLKLIRYLMKQDSCPDRSLILLRDYLTICEYMHVKPDYYPMDLKKQHDDMADLYEFQGDKLLEEYTASLADACDRCVSGKNDSTAESAGYRVVFPRCLADFINEGNMQHNCVGTYYRLVADKDMRKSIVFFIRKEDTPCESFVTAEYCRKTGELGQVLYANNRTVRAGNILSLGRFVAKKLSAGISAGIIPS